MSLPEHKRIIPHLDISEQALRELEIWLLGRLRTVRGGSGGGLQFNEGTYGSQNLGDSLYVAVTEWIGWILDLGAYFYIDSSAGGSHILEVDENGSVFWYTRGSEYILNSETGAVRTVTTGGEFQVTTEDGRIVLDSSSPGGNIILNTEGGQISMDSSGDVGVSTADGNIELITQTGRVLLRYANGSAETDIVVDSNGSHVNLNAAGKTFIVNDSLGSPLVTYTG